MIARLSGELAEKMIDRVILDVGGVGYELYITLVDYDQLVSGNKYKLYIHEHIREDSYDLYGFIDDESKKLFEQLISVKNVGPKVGLALMSIGNSASLKTAIAGGDMHTLMSAKGVGKRAAEQLVVELRDKVGLVAGAEAEEVISRSGINSSDEAVQALLALGYNEIDAIKALQPVDKDLPVGERVKQALKGVS
jgi:Holliday junction DNA helicase RuvA